MKKGYTSYDGVFVVTGDVEINMVDDQVKTLQEYLDRINESVQYGAFETASMYATNLSNFLMSIHNVKETGE